MRNFGRASLQDFLRERIIFRDLNPVDPDLARFEDVRTCLHLPENVVPRKSSPQYAQVIAYLLEMANRRDGKKHGIETIVYIGDTRMNDGRAFRNICSAGGWQGIALITSETERLTKLGLDQEYGSLLFTNSRWVNLRTLNALMQVKNLEIDERAAILIDVDKTALGARGRNDRVIDGVRVEAARKTLQGILGGSFSPQQFENMYRTLNQPVFHVFTEDNQDYLVYICMIGMCGLFTTQDICDASARHELPDFHGFLRQVEQRRKELPAEVDAVHRRVSDSVQAGDSTPFKQFRQTEYETTLQRMGQLPDDAVIEQLLREEIVITREVMEFALQGHTAGALVFGLSDKPVEACMPAREGISLPLHQMQTHVIGE